MKTVATEGKKARPIRAPGNTRKPQEATAETERKPAPEPAPESPAPPPPAAPPMAQGGLGLPGHGSMAPGAVAAGPVGPALDKPHNVAKKKMAPPRPQAPPAGKTVARGPSIDDVDEIPMPTRPAPAKEKTGARFKDMAPREKAVAAAPKVGAKAGKGSRSGGRARAPVAPEAEEARAAARAPAGDEEEEAEPEMAELLPGWFGAKIPEQMTLNESARVTVTVTRQENKAKAEAKLAAAPATQVPSQISSADILVGKLLRVELRAFASEFEILPITPPEQRLLKGRVVTWQWNVVPRQPGGHELAVVVTNLTDWKGNPVDLTVHSVNVEVQVKTVQKLKDIASMISSAMGGVMGLLGMYKGIVMPLLSRRKEKDGEKDKDKDKDKDGGDKGKDGGGDKGASASEPPAAMASAAATPPPAAANRSEAS